jgi:peptidoglycan/LPS O-acetylase OafA/YrhL
MQHAVGAKSVSMPLGSNATSASSTTFALAGTRLPFIDFVRGVAALLIVGHHLAFYGPLSDLAYPLAPRVLDWFSEHARMAVQAFLLIGGFGTARRLARLSALDVRSFAGELWGRYRRIGLPYVAALVLAVGCNELARFWMEHPSISEPPTLLQFVAHAAFLNQILGYESLTAGAWYPAIDFQLVVLSLALLWLCQKLTQRGGVSSAERAERLFVQLGGGLALGSLYWLARLSDLDVWAVYFFGSYYLGMLIEWSLRERVPRSFVWGYLALLGLAGVHESRPRLLVAGGMALLLLWSARGGIITRWPQNRLMLGLGRISYSLFLVHFPVCLVVNALGSRYLSKSPEAALCGMLGGAVLSVGVAIAFHRFVEQRCLPSRAKDTPDRLTSTPGGGGIVRQSLWRLGTVRP